MQIKLTGYLYTH